MKIGPTGVYVDDQNKALRFYTEVLGLAKKSDVTDGPYRWLTVASADERGGAELQLTPDSSDPAARDHQEAMFHQNQPATMFFTRDLGGGYERIKARDGKFTVPPTKVTGSTIAVLKDTCGNLSQLDRLSDQEA
jgi:predicted enzyme related to lactoylglutathione lyase